MKKGNIIFANVFIILGIYVIIQANKFPNLGGSKVPGPGFFPTVLGIVLIGLSILLFITTVLTKEQKAVELFEANTIKAYITMAVLMAYLYLLTVIGFIIATPLFLFGLIRFYGMQNHLKIAMSAVGATMIIYGVFKLLLAVPLPTGIFFG